MIRRILLSIFFGMGMPFIGFTAGAGAISLKNLDFMEDIAIHDRLLQTLEAQYFKWRICSKLLPQVDKELRRWYQMIGSTGFDQLSSKAQKTEILVLMSEIRSSKRAPPDCNIKPQIVSVRKAMKLPFIKHSQIMQFVHAIAPACFVAKSRGSFHEKESNACFAADGLILNDSHTYGIDLSTSPLKLSLALLQRLLLTEVGGSLELFTEFSKIFPNQGPKQFFTLLATVSTSGNSGLTGWLQGVEDHLIIQDLNNENISIPQVYERTKALQKAKISYHKLRDIADQFHVKLTIFGIEITDWNRHNMMAAYLGCREAGSQKDVVNRVYKIGIGYESRDFFSHLFLENVSLKDSAQNFKEDTARYAESSKIGYQACH